MAMVKLTTEIRRFICKDILKHRFTKPVDALVRDRAALAADTYDDIYNEASRKLMAEIPSGWLPLVSEVTARYGYTGSGYTHIPFSGDLNGPLSALISKSTAEYKNRDIPYADRNRCWKSYTPDHPLAKRYEALENTRTTLLAQVETAQAQILAALNAKTTVNSLIEAWPECEPFAKAYDISPPKLPVVQTQTLNKLLELPV